jgi:uncharacterized protein (DUF2164 family)
VSIELDENRRAAMLGDIKAFFSDSLDDEIGDLKARLVLDFFLGRLGAAIYNQAVGDSHAWTQDKLMDIEGELYQDDGRDR